MSKLTELLVELTSGDETRAEAAVPGLVALGDVAHHHLETLLGSPKVDHRWWALRVLAQNGKVEISWLIHALYDSEVEVRQCAALALCNHPDIKGIPALVNALSDSDGMVSTLAANALIVIGEPAVPPLLELLDDAPQSARLNAMRALTGIADPRAIPAMMAALEEDSAILQYWAEAGLERLGLNTVYLKPD